MQLYLGIGGLLLLAAVMGALAIWARRLGSLISLHHHLAGGTNNKDGPKRDTFRTSRRLIRPERQNQQRDV
jgi:hypothetical protein